MTRKRRLRRSVFPKKVDEVGPIIRWAFDARQRHIREIALGLDDSGTAALSVEEAAEGILRSMGRDWKAYEEDIEYYMKADSRGWWRDFPKQELLTNLFERVDRRKAGTGTPHNTRLPDHPELLPLAKALLADIRVIGPLNALFEGAAVVQALADPWLSPIGVRSRKAELRYLEESKSIPAFFDAIILICDELKTRGEAIPESWREVAEGRCRRPAAKPLPRGRPAKPDEFARDLHIQFVIELLDRLGEPPTGKEVSGCLIVAEALPVREDAEDWERRKETVMRIWKARPGSTAFLSTMRKQMKGIARRQGLDQTR